MERTPVTVKAEGDISPPLSVARLRQSLEQLAAELETATKRCAQDGTRGGGKSVIRKTRGDQRRKGESLARLASELERETWQAYAYSTPAEQEEQARLQFVETLGPGELRKHLRLQQAAFLWEEVTADEGAEGP
ncbi:hypothetical protein EOD39_13097 [Acipenser ruthenus]|uniref:Uncharacterized protein n=1 Tax=Acipenser ruthenus TaxID=7906 RepID=A0A662YPP3_ACIRT|nr:hypothetical protein EOD39_13097 [Acipenser ruthenus]